MVRSIAWLRSRASGVRCTWVRAYRGGKAIAGRARSLAQAAE
ncbi:hypothetical protein BURPS305_4719 [Burkholderia pseudomallei 305]|nr:hypothetical protein GBP346_A0527 [Burkholderia pseudomallei MSHR346]EBA48896.1 hypothetical protein BURPS305_4719 [Burkholderia pseudomallei 305]